jgi:23S rRNA pseudouridine1911/1915/1917 synthase
VVNKPAGLLSQGDETGDPSLLEVVADYLCVKYDKPGRAFVGLVHRLDRPVTGLLVLARTSKAASRLSEQVRQRHMTKRYRAWTTRAPPLGRLVGLVDGKDAALVVSSVRALTSTPFWEVELELETGRKHQIRLQLSGLGCPIVGDVRHGGPAWHDGRAIALQAGWLAFDHPTRGERLEFAIDAPSGWRQRG